MRRTRFLLLLPALLALFGTTRTADAKNTLSVSVGCWNNGTGAFGGGTFGCDAFPVTGGTGTYVSYDWRATDVLLSSTHTYHYVTSNQYLENGTCRVGATVTVRVTVTDSLGETGTGSFSFRCRSTAD